MTAISLSDRPFDASDHPIRRSKHGRSPSGGGKLRHYLAEAPLTADRLASRFGHAADDGALPAADVEHPVGAGSDFGFCGAAGFAGRRLEGVSAPFVRHGLRRRLTRGQRQSPLWELDYIMATASSASASLQPAWRWRDGGPATGLRPAHARPGRPELRQGDGGRVARVCPLGGRLGLYPVAFCTIRQASWFGSRGRRFAPGAVRRYSRCHHAAGGPLLRDAGRCVVDLFSACGI